MCSKTRMTEGRWLPKVGKESQALFAVPRRAQFFQPFGSVIGEFFPAKIRGLQRPRWPASCTRSNSAQTRFAPCVVYRSVSRHPSNLVSSSLSQKSSGLLLKLVRGGDEGVHLALTSTTWLQAAARLPSLKFHA